MKRRFKKLNVLFAVLLVFAISSAELAVAVPPTVVTGPPSPALDKTPPSIIIISPGAGWTLTNAIDVIADATDNAEVSRVEFFVDGTFSSSDSSSPYTFSWNTKSAANGLHTLSAAAFDPNGNVGAAAMFVTVANPGAQVIAAAPPAVLPAYVSRLYQVHIGAYRFLRTARRRLAGLRRRGFRGEIIVQGGRRPYLVQVIITEDSNLAKRLVSRLRRKGLRYARVNEVFR